MNEAELKLLKLKVELLEEQLTLKDQLLFNIKHHARPLRELVRKHIQNDYALAMPKDAAALVTDYLLALERENLTPLPNCQHLNDTYTKIIINKTLLSKL